MEMGPPVGIPAGVEGGLNHLPPLCYLVYWALGEEFGELSYTRPMGVMRIAATKALGRRAPRVEVCPRGQLQKDVPTDNIPQVIH